MLPLSTTTFTISRSANDGTVDLYDAQPAPSTVASGVRGVMVAPTARADVLRGERVVATAGFRADPTDVQEGDTLVDDTTGIAYTVVWAANRYELGLRYSYGNLINVRGAVQ